MAFRKGVEYEPQNDDLKQKLEDAERQAKYAPKRFREDGVRFPQSCPHFDTLSILHSLSSSLLSTPPSSPRRRAMLSSVTPSTSRPLRSTPGAFLSFSSARSSEIS